MQLTYLHIHNFKSIRDMEIRDIDRALILVGKNNTGKTSILDAVCAVCGCYQVQETDFNEREQAIRIDASFSISGEDLALFHRMGSSASTGGMRCGGGSSANGFPPSPRESFALPSM